MNSFFSLPYFLPFIPDFILSILSLERSDAVEKCKSSFLGLIQFEVHLLVNNKT